MYATCLVGTYCVLVSTVLVVQQRHALLRVSLKTYTFRSWGRSRSRYRNRSCHMSTMVLLLGVQSDAVHDDADERDDGEGGDAYKRLEEQLPQLAKVGLVGLA